MHLIRARVVYAVLALAWLLVVGWQVVEHNRIRTTARTALLDRAHDISNTLGVVMRTQSRFGLIPKPRLEAALEELSKSRELESVALLNDAGEVTAAAGEPIEVDLAYLTETGAKWDGGLVTILDLVDLGRESESGRPGRPERSGTIVVTESVREELFPEGPDGRRGRGRRSEWGRGDVPGRGSGTPPPEGAPPPPWEGGPPQPTWDGGPPPPPPEGHPEPDVREGVREGGRRGGGAFRFRRPPRMTEEQYKELAEKQGVRYFVISMVTDAVRTETTRDFWLRMGIGGVALVAALGLGVATSIMSKTAELQMRLLRASEMNAHLRELSVAAAGLAHETRNPLNIIRGQAQLINKLPEIPAAVKEKTTAITEEVDRVTGRLNQFIDYSRPTEVRPAATNLQAVITDVAWTLESDLEDKGLKFLVSGPNLTVEADESLLRQVLFNLILNAIQAVGGEGTIVVVIEDHGGGEGCFEVCDDGPGVPAEAMEEIFRPYFTASEEGTGLGLTVVRQIVLAHQWEIVYIPGDEGGSRFCVTGLQVS